ncbi:LysR family transcriptional regulator [Verminephrobacter aporrectodeae subsp. tuberculatae]|uniref:LysR substrate-binding domain-containing protein n=1 Tax=Verminephrobacter aporrectodeae TaxID=1110389 RepID=UPI002242F36C|nr:LysR substrate-binding domain-containing protein [Verminephrobacter aporrectodeae]MCW8209324.1 LysR family transcriptional regulator [Verminephrobacter aporrectodeae subsp. tuberculatae]
MQARANPADPCSQNTASAAAGVAPGDGLGLSRRLVNRLRLKHWVLLGVLGEASTLRHAAARIHMTQPGATKMLADIEHAFGFALFERHARGLRVTALGREVLAYARQAQAALERFLEDLETKRHGGHGHLVFGAIMGAAPDLVARAVADIKRERPLLNVRILGETSDQICGLLERHEIELAVGRLPGPLEHNKFDFAALSDEPLCAVVRRRHALLRRRQPLGWPELVRWPWVLQLISSPARVLLEEEFARARVGAPQNMIECTSIFATLQLVQSSDAIAMLPESVVRDHVRARLLQVLPIEIGRDLRAFGLLTRKNETLSEFATLFVDHLRRYAGGCAQR